MSEIRSIIADVIADREATFGDAATNDRTKRNFTAEIEPIADMEMNEALGRDKREAVLFHIRDRAAADELVTGDTVSTLFGKFKILRRSNNPISLQVEFGAMKVTNKDA